MTCESSMAVIIDVIEDEIESHEATENSHGATENSHKATENSHEATENSHEATENSHQATIQTESEPLSADKGVKERKKTSEIWKYFKVDKSDNKKAICLTCEEKVS